MADDRKGTYFGFLSSYRIIQTFVPACRFRPDGKITNIYVRSRSWSSVIGGSADDCNNMVEIQFLFNDAMTRKNCSLLLRHLLI